MKKSYEEIIKYKKDSKLVYRIGGGGTVEIFDISVSPLRKGIGTLLLNKLRQKKLGRIFAITHSQNEVAQKFYERNGMVGTRLPNFYQVYSPYTTGDAIMYIEK